MFYSTQTELLNAALDEIEQRMIYLRKVMSLAKEAGRSYDDYLGEFKALDYVSNALSIARMGAVFLLDCEKELPNESHDYLTHKLEQLDKKLAKLV